MSTTCASLGVVRGRLHIHKGEPPRNIVLGGVAEDEQSAINDPYRKPYSCKICGLRLDHADTAKLDQVIARHGKVVRVICTSHTAAMNNREFQLLVQ